MNFVRQHTEHIFWSADRIDFIHPNGLTVEYTFLLLFYLSALNYCLLRQLSNDFLSAFLPAGRTRSEMPFYKLSAVFADHIIYIKWKQVFNNITTGLHDLVPP